MNRLRQRKGYGMGKLKFDYSSLKNTSTEAKRASLGLSDYRSDLEGRVAGKLAALPGSDPCGYIGNALQSISRKNADLAADSDRFATFSAKAERLADDAEKADRNAAKQIKETGGSYVGKRNWFQRAGDWIYGTFCVDLPNLTGLGKFVGDTMGWVGTRVSNSLEGIYNWFKYKEGKYVWNIIKDTAGFVGSVAAAAAAVLAISFASPVVAVVTVMGAGAACVLVMTTAVNSEVSINENLRALDTAKKGELGKARYQGGTSGFLEYTKRTDFGGKEINRFMEDVGEDFDKVEKTAETVKMTTDILMVGAKVDPKTGKAEDISWDQAKKNIKESFGFKRERYSLGENGKKIPYNGEKSGYKYSSWSADNMFDGRSDGDEKKYLQKFFGMGSSDDMFYELEKHSATNAELFAGLSPLERSGKAFFDTAGVVDKTMEHAESVDALFLDGDKDAWDKTESGFNLGSASFKPLKTVKTVVFKPIDLLRDRLTADQNEGLTFSVAGDGRF